MDPLKCFFCLGNLIGTPSEIHHYIPKYVGGKDIPENRVPVCYGCHRRLHSKPQMNTWVINRFIYELLCFILEIVPVTDGYDDDLHSWMKKENILQIDKKFRQLSLGMSLTNGFLFGDKRYKELWEKVNKKIKNKIN